MSFQELLEGHYHSLAGDEALKPIRKKAWDQFQSLGLPQKQHETWRSIKLRKLYGKTLAFPSSEPLSKTFIAPMILPGFEKRCLVFSNGKLQSDLSSLEDLEGRLIVSSLGQAVKSYGGFLNYSWSTAIKEEKDPFAVLNSALGGGGAFLYLPPKTGVAKPLQILSVSHGEASQFVQPRLHLFAGKQSQISLISTPCILASGSASNASFMFSLEEGAEVSFYQLNHQLPNAHWQLESVRAHLKRDSRFSAVNISNGSETVRSDYKAVLAGENGEVDLAGLSMLNDYRESHVNILIEHKAPHCRSNQRFKGVLDGCGRSSFEGKIYVHPSAQKTDAFQLNNHLLLSETAHAFSKPNLEIFADDVKASHGATVGRLNQEHLFYLKTRGYSQKEAERVLVKGFYLEIIDLIRDEDLQKKVIQDLNQGW